MYTELSWEIISSMHFSSKQQQHTAAQPSTQALHNHITRWSLIVSSCTFESICPVTGASLTRIMRARLMTKKKTTTSLWGEDQMPLCLLSGHISERWEERWKPMNTSILCELNLSLTEIRVEKITTWHLLKKKTQSEKGGDYVWPVFIRIKRKRHKNEVRVIHKLRESCIL